MHGVTGDFGVMGVLAACVVVLARWVWLRTRFVDPRVFMMHIEKLVRAGNMEMALKLCMVAPDDPLCRGTRAVLDAHMAGRRMNETELLDVFDAALPGGSLDEALSWMQALTGLSFFVVCGIAAVQLYVQEGHVSTFFWVACGAYAFLFFSATRQASALKFGIYEAAGRLMQLLAVPDENDPGVDAQPDDPVKDREPLPGQVLPLSPGPPPPSDLPSLSVSMSSPGPPNGPISLLPSPVPLVPSGDSPAAGKQVVCRNCGARIAVDAETLSSIESELDLWSKIRERCPRCGGTFFELRS